MPESPEVQALAQALDERVVGRRVVAVDLIEFRALKTRRRPLESIVGERITGVQRRGKHLDIALENAHLVVSLGRHGWVRFTEGTAEVPDDPDAPALAVLTIEGGTLELTDAGAWVSLGLSVVDTAEEVAAIAGLGPDPLGPEFSRTDVDAAVARRRKQLKAILQEQSSFAGIGNAYSDEILHRARLSPVVHGDTLSDDELERLFAAMRDVVRGAAADRRGVPIGELKRAKTTAMAVHGRAGEECPVCGGTVADLSFGGTTAQYCPTCQTAGVLLG
jgi:formamidopyrimidine-DNA glycosylase